MANKRMTQRNRAITLTKMKAQLHLLYREDLVQLRQAIEDALLVARPAPAEDKLTAPGEWLEERRLSSKKPGSMGRYYVYLRWIDDAGKERGTIVYRGTLAQYKTSRLGCV